MTTHKELKEFINRYNLVSSIDHLIACDNHGWTDLRFTQLDNRLRPESKYFLAININNEPHILYYEHLFELRHEIDEKMIKKPYISGYDKKNNRVHLHYERDGIFRIGNKNGANTFRVQFEECTLKDLAKRHDYKIYLSLLENAEKHRSIQTLLCELGISLGFFVKLAYNDKTNILNNHPLLVNSQIIQNIYDLNLGIIGEKIVEKDIDAIDVLWCDPITKKIVIAFEVEFSNNYAKLFQRFDSLIKSIPYPISLIGVGNDYRNFKYNLNRPTWRSAFFRYNLGYLQLHDLCDILTLNREIGSSIHPKIILNKLVKEKLLKI